MNNAWHQGLRIQQVLPRSWFCFPLLEEEKERKVQEARQRRGPQSSRRFCGLSPRKVLRGRVRAPQTSKGWNGAE